MTMLTVDDLARDLKVRNEDLVRELVIMGFQVEGPESPLETDDPVALRAQLVTALPQREIIEKRIKPTVIRRRIKEKPPETPATGPQPTEPALEATDAPSAAAEAKEVIPEVPAPKTRGAAKKAVKKTPKVEPARIIERAARVSPAPEPPSTLVVEKKPVTGKAPEVQAMPSEELPPSVAPPARLESSASEPALEVPVGGDVSQAEAPRVVEEAKVVDERAAKKKKKKEKRVQPAQIIGKVELKKEPPSRPEPEEPVKPPRVVTERVMRVVETPAPLVTPETEEEARRKDKKDKKKREVIAARVEDDGLKVRRRREVNLRDDLYDDKQRYGRLRGKGKKARPRKTEITVPKAIKRRLKLPEIVTVSDLAHKMSIKATEVIRRLLGLGVSSSMNEGIDIETATIVASEFGFEVESAEHSEVNLLPASITDTEQNLQSRPPVITVMGHVDHGKTSLLDFIRSTHVTAQEAGGITQHIGAYKVKLGNKGEIVFLDTPGHEAFTAMRARGAQVTDFVVLVVAADDGVKDQTREAINHARAAKVPIVVAVNKIDKPEADRDRVIRELSEHDLIPEAWGGETLFTFVSAKSGEGVSEFLEAILLQAEMMELRANPDKTASGTIIEARLDKGKGPVATVLVRQGTLKLGDAFVAGVHYGKVRAMLDHEGRAVTSAGPATPVEVHGFSGVPEAGEKFLVVDEERIARQIGDQRQQKQKQMEVSAAGPVSLEDLLAKMQQQEIKELNIIIKADVQGSVEALQEAIQGISTDEVKVKVIHSGVGTVTESDVMLASASDALVIGFNVRPGPKTLQLAEEKKIDVRLHSVIYDVLEEVQKASLSMLAPVEKETVVGRAEVRQTFSVAKVGTIAGCHVTWGKIQRSNNVRLLRDDVPVYDGKIFSIRRFKDDVKEVLEGYECGIVLENFRDIKVGDVIEGYIIEQEPAKLS